MLVFIDFGLLNYGFIYILLNLFFVIRTSCRKMSGKAGKGLKQ